MLLSSRWHLDLPHCGPHAGNALSEVLHDATAQVTATVPSNVVYQGVRSYTTYGSYTADFHVWVGDKTILRSLRLFTPAEAKTIVTHNDQCFALYQRYGQRTWPGTIDAEFGAKGQLALVPDGKSCGAGCGAGGHAEMTDQIFDSWRGARTNTDPYAWWVGYYELGREGGRAFPFFTKLDHYRGSSSVPGERLAGAFPEYIWQRCLRNVGFTQDQLVALAQEPLCAGIWLTLLFNGQPADRHENVKIPTDAVGSGQCALAASGPGACRGRPAAR